MHINKTPKNVNNLINKHLQLLILFFISTIVINAEIKLPSIFGSNMVLQQNSNVAFWGSATPNAKVTIQASWHKQKQVTLADKNGQWRLKIDTPQAGGPHTIKLSDGKVLELKNVMLGEVWLCAGQSNMEMPMKGFMAQPVANANNDILRSKNSNIRLLTVPRASTSIPQSNFEGQWKEASPEAVANFSATAYYFGKLINEVADVPIGLICVSYGGSCIEAWMSAETSSPFEDKGIPRAGDSIQSPNRTPTVLFNGMLNPVIGYGLQGVIWYQGETNYQNWQNYAVMMQKMVNDWRQRWQIGEFPFYFAQIAPFNYASLTPGKWHEHYNSAYLREAQLKAVDLIPNSAITYLTDAGEENNIHPSNKKIVGERLAYLALQKTYNIKGFGADCPVVNEVNFKDSTVIVNFKNTPNGITAYGKEVTLFELAGSDKKFHRATAVLGRKSVTLHSPNVPQPQYVRYAFKDFVTAEIFSTEGLPLTSFRTDQ